jgi:hypothetical protein
MQKFTIFLVMCLLFVGTLYGETFTNGVFVPIEGQSQYQSVKKGEPITTNTFNLGETYQINRQIYEIPTKDTPILLYFSNDLITEVNTNSQLSVVGLEHSVSNMDDPPSKIKTESSLLNISLDYGDATFVLASPQNENSSCVVSTPFVDLELIQGKFFVRVGENSVYVFVESGKLNAHEDSGQVKEVKEGNALISVRVVTSPKDDRGELFYSSRPPKKDEFDIKTLNQTIKKLEGVRSSVIFAVVDKKIVAIDIH